MWGIGIGGGFIDILVRIMVRGGRVKIRGKRKEERKKEGKEGNWLRIGNGLVLVLVRIRGG